jgi:hypothetical protein
VAKLRPFMFGAEFPVFRRCFRRQTSEEVRKKMVAGHMLSVTATEVHAPVLASPAKEVESHGAAQAASSPSAPATPPRVPYHSLGVSSQVVTPAPPPTDKTSRSSAIRNPMLTAQSKPGPSASPTSPGAHQGHGVDVSRVATPAAVSALSLLKSKTTSSLPASALVNAYISGSCARTTQQVMGSPASRLKGSAVHAAANSMLFAAKSKTTHKYLAHSAGLCVLSPARLLERCPA